MDSNVQPLSFRELQAGPVKVGAGVFHLLCGIYQKSLQPDQCFRAAALDSIVGGVTGQWCYTQIYIGHPKEEFDLHPKRSVIVSENAENELLSVTYRLNDVDHVAPAAALHHFFEFSEVVTRTAFFLLRGRPMHVADEVYLAASNGELFEEVH